MRPEAFDSHLIVYNQLITCLLSLRVFVGKYMRMRTSDDARKFASILREDLKNAADEMAHRFNSKIEPMVKRAESAERRISVPTLAAYIVLTILVWMIIFLVMVIYANTKIRSGDTARR